MPLSGGTSGAHDDSMHQGSAKRDAVNGVAALNSVGDLLVLGSSIEMIRDVADKLFLLERTSGETISAYQRLGADNYQESIRTATGWHRMLHVGNKDVANGIAALDAGGHVLAPGYRFTAARGAAEQITIRERTSDERVFRWIRIGADDYEARVTVGGVEKVVQHAGLKDVADGIAGLDADVQLDVLQMRSCLEEYSNHLGAVDNFTQTATGGNGTANTDAANHEMDMLSGVTVVGHASFRTKSGFAVVAKPIIFNGIVQNIVLGAGGSRWVKIGFAATWVDGTSVDSVCIVYDLTGVWFAYTAEGINFTKTTIPNLANGDLITIVATSSEIIFLVNGAVVATHTTDIPTNPMKGGIACGSDSVAATTSIQVSADMIGMKRYV